MSLSTEFSIESLCSSLTLFLGVVRLCSESWHARKLLPFLTSAVYLSRALSPSSVEIIETTITLPFPLRIRRQLASSHFLQPRAFAQNLACILPLPFYQLFRRLL